MRRNLRKKVQSIIKIGDPVNLCLQDGQQIAIVGDNAVGKTALVNILMGRSRLPGNPVSYDFSPSASNMVSDNIKYIEFQDAYGAAGANYYHQLRWNSVEIDEETPTAGELLQGVGDEALREELFPLFNQLSPSHATSHAKVAIMAVVGVGLSHRASNRAATYVNKPMMS